MIVSMTGYGRGVKENDQLSVTVEVKSVNHRFCDISVRIPKQFLMFEDSIKKIIQQYIHRGRVDVFVTIEGEGMVTRSLEVDWNLLEQYYYAFKKAQEKFAFKDELQLKEFMHVPDVFQVNEKEQHVEELEEMIVASTHTAVQSLIQMRKSEGQSTYTDFQKRLHNIQQTVDQLSSYSKKVVDKYRERLLKKVKEFLSETMEIDDSKILTEVALFADKSDINEELERIKSHISQFLETIESNEPVGRKLDFLIQEMNREVNTIGSKANDVEISQKVVDMKSELEKMKERVQNIE